jgi:hypothetical protein
LDLEDDEPATGIYIPSLLVTTKNIQKLKDATLEQTGMGSEDLDRLRNAGAAHYTLDMLDTHLVKVLRHFIYSTDTSCHHYETIQKIDMVAYPGNNFLSFD